MHFTCIRSKMLENKNGIECDFWEHLLCGLFRTHQPYPATYIHILKVESCSECTLAKVLPFTPNPLQGWTCGKPVLLGCRSCWLFGWLAGTCDITNPTPWGSFVAPKYIYILLNLRKYLPINNWRAQFSTNVTSAGNTLISVMPGIKEGL